MVRLAQQAFAACLLIPALFAAGLGAQPPNQDPHEFLEIGGYVLKADGAEVSPVRFFRSNAAGSVLIVTPTLDGIVELAPARRQKVLRVYAAEAFSEKKEGVMRRSPDANPTTTGSFAMSGQLPSFQWQEKSYRLEIKPPLLGPQTQEGIVEYDRTWGLRSKLYEPYSQYLNPLLDVQQDVVVKIYFGSWCNHCQDMVPKIFKVEQQLVNSKIRFEYHGLPLKIQDDPEAKAYEIEGQLPFGVVFVDGKESGRAQGLSWRFPDLAITTALLKSAGR